MQQKALLSSHGAFDLQETQQVVQPVLCSRLPLPAWSLATLLLRVFLIVVLQANAMYTVVMIHLALKCQVWLPC